MPSDPALRLHQAADTPTLDQASASIPADAWAFTRQQIAALLQISDRSAKRLDAERLIPGRFTVGRSVRFRRRDVEKWVAAGCPRPARPQKAKR